MQKNAKQHLERKQLHKSNHYQKAEQHTTEHINSKGILKWQSHLREVGENKKSTMKFVKIPTKPEFEMHP